MSILITPIREISPTQLAAFEERITSAERHIRSTLASLGLTPNHRGFYRDKIRTILDQEAMDLNCFNRLYL